ncbi:hypothetical protein L226DRAFT_73177 [Lentinus tigrinus ALCF2SS1-7]|uniref:uncharacterized protein n=1 Tax=Lentinus tigrinus ALCF2SS1-7 TaxID=1328758 RepID=UPI001165D4A4|nr:hypothetical protein L226DRAFT_73177 [Lentinus tigrinus ALCF2SS1-7]
MRTVWLVNIPDNALCSHRQFWGADAAINAHAGTYHNSIERMERPARKSLRLWQSYYHPAPVMHYTYEHLSIHPSNTSSDTHVLVRGWFSDVRARSSETRGFGGPLPYLPPGLSLCPWYPRMSLSMDPGPERAVPSSLSVDCLCRVLIPVKRHVRGSICMASSCPTEAAALVHDHLLTRYGHAPSVIVAE